VACVLTAAWTAFSSTNARADGNGAASPPANEPADVTVYGVRDAGSFVSRASVDDSTREVTDAASLLEPLPGVHVRRLGADDSFATLSIRGSSSS